MRLVEIEFRPKKRSDWQVKARLRDVRIGIAQINPVLGDIEANVDKHLEFIRRAVDDKCGLVVFPELSLTGYVLEDLSYDVAVDIKSSAINRLRECSGDVSIIAGFIHHTSDHQFKIASAYFEDGEIVHVHHKVYLVTYGLFDEGRFCAPGDRIRAFNTKFGRQAVLICEDLWHPSSMVIAAGDGADIIHAPAASPGRGVSGSSQQLGSSRTWHDLTRTYSQMFVNYGTFANRVGYEDGINYYGLSQIVGPDGAILAEAPADEECLIAADLTDGALRRARISTPLRRDEKLELTIEELRRIKTERSQ